ncbi:MAG TPA: hypothetical protein VFC22_01155, partial [Solirubrobacteraceae bacterium]|nr:hypothetical protein [Solirubrobacteraceae bacterium]
AVIRSVGITPWWLYVPASEWERKADVQATPSTGARDWTIAILVALVLAGMIGAFVGRWDIAAATLIGLGLCAAIGLEAASNPAKPLLAGTLGYTMWWGSELGLWVWLIVAWAAWLGALAVFRRLARFAIARWRVRLPMPGSRLRIASRAAAFLGALAGTVAVGAAVAATQTRDSHAYDYQPIRTIAAGIERLVAPGQTLHLYTGGLNVATQPTEPAIRFFLVRHGDRVLANGSLPRLGPYYELYHRPVQWAVYLVDGTHPQPHMTLAARVRYTSPWGHETLTAWVQKVQ